MIIVLSLRHCFILYKVDSWLSVLILHTFPYMYIYIYIHTYGVCLVTWIISGGMS